MFIVRIYTTVNGVGQIQMDNVTIDESLYHRIQQSEYYYYENVTTNDTHHITSSESDFTFAVSYCLKVFSNVV